MPLKKGTKPGSKGFKENIEELVHSGRPQKQAVAIAYAESRKNKGNKKHKEK